MKILDNVTNTVRDDLHDEIKRGSKISVAAACFSMYAYQELRKELERLMNSDLSLLLQLLLKRRQKNRKENSISRVSLVSPVYTAQNLKLNCAMK